MGSKRITVSIPAELFARLAKVPDRAPSLSAWVADAMARALEEEESRQRFVEFCENAPATKGDARRARASFDQIMRRPKRTKRAA